MRIEELYEVLAIGTKVSIQVKQTGLLNPDNSRFLWAGDGDETPIWLKDYVVENVSINLVSETVAVKRHTEERLDHAELLILVTEPDECP